MPPALHKLFDLYAYDEAQDEVITLLFDYFIIFLISNYIEEFVWKPTSTVEDQCELHTPLHNEVQSLHNQAHLEIPGFGIKRRLGIKKI